METLLSVVTKGFRTVGYIDSMRRVARQCGSDEPQLVGLVGGSLSPRSLRDDSVARRSVDLIRLPQNDSAGVC